MKIKLVTGEHFDVQRGDSDPIDISKDFGASGDSHAPGLVPDPGSTSGTSKFLREDGTWQEPGSGGDADTVDGYHIAVVASMPAEPAEDTIYIIK